MVVFQALTWEARDDARIVDGDSDGPLEYEEEDDYKLHRRVAAWQSKAEPLLLEQSCRASYDVHED